MAPLEPLRKCLFLVVLSTDIIHITIFNSPSGVRNQSGFYFLVRWHKLFYCRGGHSLYVSQFANLHCLYILIFELADVLARGL
jgi:hypothetical protein